jgi:hypothetical protein
MEPELVYLIACQDVQLDPVNLHRINLRGLMARLWSNATPPFPSTSREFCVFTMFVGGQGPIDIVIRIVSEATGATIFRTAVRRFRFLGGPSDLTGATFRIRGCTFPAAGLYWIECLAGQNVIGRQRLWASPRGTVP